MMRSRRADANWWVILLVIAIAGGLIGLMLSGKIWSIGSSAVPKCNTFPLKCACFFDDNRCPSSKVGTDSSKVEGCPAEGDYKCTESNYELLVKDSKIKKGGTCCILSKAPSDRDLWDKSQGTPVKTK